MAEKTAETRAPVSQRPGPSAKAKDPGAIGGQVSVTIDGNEIKVPLGTTILEAAEQLGIRIPTLCHHEDLCIAGVCRVCVVEIEGQRTLQASCAYPITSPLKVRTHSPKVRRARRHVVDLLLSKHYGQCYTCLRNNNCELQALAKEYGVDTFRFGQMAKPEHEVDRSSYAVVRDMNKCVMCRRCVRTCIDLQEVGVLDVTQRGSHATVSTFMDKPLGEVVCINCGQCINRCPTGALRANDPTDEVWAAIDDPEKHVVIQTAPSPRAAIGECFGLEPGTAVTFELNTALRRCGFDKVFDTNFTADLTIIEEGTELLIRLKKALVDKDSSVALPQFTSCSPGWVKYIEHFYPEMLAHVSSAKSPQQMFGALIKTFYAQEKGIDPRNIVSVALMPCSAKKFECNRPEMTDSGYKDVDYGLTSRELAQMISEAGIDLPAMPKSDFDDPFGSATGSGVIFGASGGVMEAAIRTAHFLATGREMGDLKVEAVRGMEGTKEARVHVNGTELGVAVVNGLGNAAKLLDQIRDGRSDLHFIEVMTCPGGCVGGGGQPIRLNRDAVRARMQGLYDIDEKESARTSHGNQSVQRLYEEFLEKPLGEKSRVLLHTHYAQREALV